MRTSLLLAALAFAAAPLAAQGSGCGAFTGSSRRVCDAAVDASRAFHPVAGLLVSGGNPVIGTANTLGGLEAGYQSGRDQELSTEFADYDTTGKFFAGFGLRLDF